MNLVKRTLVGELPYDAQVESPPEKTLRNTTILVGGMTCAACVRRVENALNSVPGVESAAVNLSTSRATVIYSPGLADWPALGAAIEEAGYEYLGLYEEGAGDQAEAARRAELADLKRKVAAGAVLSVLIMAGSMQHHFPVLNAIPARVMLYILLALSTPAVFWVGKRFLTNAIKATLHKTADMNTLVAIGSLSAYTYSSAATLFPQFFSFQGREPPIYFDGAAMIVTLVLLGRASRTESKGQDFRFDKKIDEALAENGQSNPGERGDGHTCETGSSREILSSFGPEAGFRLMAPWYLGSLLQTNPC